MKKKYICADWVLVCDDEFTIIENGAIVFDDKIIDVDSCLKLKTKYPNCTFEYLGKNSVLMPGLINAHVHLEFSANKTTLVYGNFVQWLFSVIKHREELINKASKELLDQKLNDMLQSGVTTIGAISSYGFELESCINTSLNVVYFNEILGSKADMVDTLFADFQQRLDISLSYKKDNFIPAIAIHSAYSTHPFLIREVLKIAKKHNMPVSAHFMESQAENDWLNYSKGEFEQFFQDMLGQSIALTTPIDFLKQFEGLDKLSFAHCTRANKQELQQIKNLNATIIHCPNSNRLLNNDRLNLNFLDDIALSIGTDGLSSNYTLKIFDEIKDGFFMHYDIDTKQLAKKLLLSATNGGAKALGLQKGILKKDYDADIISFKIDDSGVVDSLPVAIILQDTKPTHIFIKGKDEINK